jgi:hypothetical protein
MRDRKRENAEYYELTKNRIILRESRAAAPRLCFELIRVARQAP